MYLKCLRLQNVGPVKDLLIEPSFIDEIPKPLVIVGQNGSGKSIALSFVANCLLNIQQHLFENTEVEKGKVFKVRSGIYIGPNLPYYFGSVELTGGLSLEEWYLSGTKKSLVEQGVAPGNQSWSQLGDLDTDGFFQAGESSGKEKLEQLYAQGVALYFPANRFEEPAWLNSESVVKAPKVTTEVSFKGITKRQIICSNVFQSLVSWIYDVLIDAYLFETQEIEVSFPDGTKASSLLPVTENSNWTIKTEIENLLATIFAGRTSGKLVLTLTTKPVRQISIAERQGDGSKKIIVPNIASLSSGESLLLGMFTSIVRDFELSGSPFRSLAEISGIVVIDEIDLHLHIDLQRHVLPRLIKAFPKVQFIVTTHSPLFLLGMEECYGPEGYDILELPTGRQIYAEEFGEFQNAYDEFSKSKRHQSTLELLLSTTQKPYLITEGDSDKTILEAAWGKLYGLAPCVFEIKSAKEINGQTGGAQQVQSSLRYLAALAETQVVGLFDNDREGNAQFNGLKYPKFDLVTPGHKKHRNVSGILLPVPQSRLNYVHQSKGEYCHLEIEHYFSDSILREHKKLGDEIIKNSGVFEIKGDKTSFAQVVAELGKEEFENFHVLFETITKILGVNLPEKST